MVSKRIFNSSCRARDTSTSFPCVHRDHNKPAKFCEDCLNNACHVTEWELILKLSKTRAVDALLIAADTGPVLMAGIQTEREQNRIIKDKRRAIREVLLSKVKR